MRVELLLELVGLNVIVAHREAHRLEDDLKEALEREQELLARESGASLLGENLQDRQTQRAFGIQACGGPTKLCFNIFYQTLVRGSRW